MFELGYNNFALILFIFILTVPFLFAYITASLRQMHMFQLNSYTAAKHLRWMKKNFSAILTNVFALVLSFLIFPAVVLFFGIYIYALVLIIFGFINIPKKRAKKPLVFTPRVIRMFVTEAVVTLVIVLVSFVCFGGGVPALLLLTSVLMGLYALVPFIVILVNYINSPVEAAVRQHYINDAKKKLKSCPDLKVIGITGSYGKTSMKFYLSTLLRGKYDTLMTPESYNTPMGVVKTIRGSLKGYHQIFVCEMGAYRVGEIDELCRIADPDHGIVTSIGPQHLETFKSVENVVKTKFELADHVLKKNGTCFLNLDNEFIRANLPEGCYLRNYRRL